ncbi:MAG: FAD-dependent oxidoreductase [Actinobacteria bacterium]|nr:FAD-dependent oxidoreductase [Actinomycetota bacterium]
MNRRNFFKGAGVIGGTVALSSLIGCSAKTSSSEEANAEEAEAITPVGTYTADVCVMGAGISGLTTTVQALENGLSVVLIEKSGGTGGGGRGTEGVFAVGSQMQQGLGINIDPAAVISREMSYHHNRTDGLRWLDLIKASGDNIAWLIENGVQFTGVVDDYHGGEFETFHWFGENRAAEAYAPPMTKRAEDLGATILLNTTGDKLIVDTDGKVTGIYAKKADGSYIQINAKAVVFAGGGFANNDEYLARGHFSNVENVQRFLYGFNGDGLRMATEIGGTDALDRFSGLFQLTVSGAPGGEYGTFGSGNGLVVGSHSGNNIWIQETGERYCAENSGDENWMALMTPTQVHKDFFSIFDRETFNGNVKNIMFPADTYDESMAEIDERFKTNPYGDAFVADTIEELAKMVSAAFPEIDVETFVATVDRYNEMCATGVDADFGKPSKYMVAMAKGPFYCIRQIQACMVTFGGIRVNRKFECIKSDWSSIPGLYSVGVDSADIWPNVYTINVPGGTNANNVNSGRSAANNILEFVGNEATGTITTEGDTSPSVIVWDEGAMPSSMKDGTYTSEPARGMFGTITATVTISSGKIKEITQVNELETSYIGVVAMENVLIPEIIAANDVHVDAVSGATHSSNGLRKAVLDCCKQAAE